MDFFTGRVYAKKTNIMTLIRIIITILIKEFTKPTNST